MSDFALTLSDKHFCYTRNGYLHTTTFELAEQYPHLIRRWKSRATAQACLNRIIAKYEGDVRFGVRSKYRIVELDQ